MTRVYRLCRRMVLLPELRADGRCYYANRDTGCMLVVPESASTRKDAPVVMEIKEQKKRRRGGTEYAADLQAVRAAGELYPEPTGEVHPGGSSDDIRSSAGGDADRGNDERADPAGEAGV